MLQELWLQIHSFYGQVFLADSKAEVDRLELGQPAIPCKRSLLGRMGSKTRETALSEPVWLDHWPGCLGDLTGWKDLGPQQGAPSDWSAAHGQNAGASRVSKMIADQGPLGVPGLALHCSRCQLRS